MPDADPVRRTAPARWAAALLLPLCFASSAAGEVATLKSGLRIEGAVVEMTSITENPLNPKTGGEGPSYKQIVMLDDDLRRVFVPERSIASLAPSIAGNFERIQLQQRVAKEGRRVVGLGEILRSEPFDDWGRRRLTMAGGKQGVIDLIQGITEITPLYTKVEGLLASNGLVSDMRIRTSTIPRDALSRILLRHSDAKNPDQRLQIVRLYIQSERYEDARDELARVIKDFPDLTDLQKQVAALYQLGARRLIQEVELRRAAGQHTIAQNLLTSFPAEGVAGETLLQVRDLLAEYQKQDDQRASILSSLEQHVGQIKDEALRAGIAPAVEEIKAELNYNNLDRLADYLRLASDEKLTPEQRVALAITGWLLGSGAGEENLPVASSLFQVRDLVVAYLQTTAPHEREQILAKLGSLEGGTPRYLEKIVAHIKPPAGELPEPLEGIPGCYELRRPGLSGDEDVRYLIQLPPEYDPYRRYPCVVALDGARVQPYQQLDWWAGAYNPALKMRLGQASRRGFVVITPYWRRDYQTEYEYSLREHAAVLLSLRDACRRFSIDTDRVFLSGYSMGGDAAWDLGLAHPDLWAGVIPIVATSGKYVTRYWENADRVPFYFVFGELDGSRIADNSMDLDRYLTRSKGIFDVMVVEYRGRGHERFNDETQEIFTWMSLPGRRRDFLPQKFEAFTMRPWDNFFWYVEMDELPARSMVAPLNWPDNKARPAIVSGEILPNNRVLVKSAAGSTTVWLMPGVVDFDRPYEININGRNVREEIRPSAAVLLEDVRVRCDRQHPAWAKATAKR